ncbi:anaerobic ribonucleoside-triphosphate reductase [Candidatus Enterovibrio escicola]|uniref:anaerobic ribonucleoside-triphosphate reductase n=1 Tax=Candidatus Enterovibrio escicola TaxID=1927127 RepID=UPI0012380F9E|nr:anaerobic ribonucleoside-triphosphate reductase [Candidatus Enterovibrio escacola]
MKPVVIKRDGSREPFQQQRIENAIISASQAIKGMAPSYAAGVADDVLAQFRRATEVEIHQIQDAVENHLMAGPYKAIARSYIEYRHDRDNIRECKNRLNQDIRGLVEQTNPDILNENANKDSKVIPTQRDLLAGIVAKHYAKQYMLPKTVVSAHEQGDIHYHDLDYAPFFPMFNCMLIDLEGMLTKGFKMGDAEIDQPKSITTATSVTAQIIAQVASHIYGGTTINRIDEILSPYVEISYEKHLNVAKEWGISDFKGYARSRTQKECYDAFQSLEYEVNTLHTANGQTPFVTFGFGLGESWSARLIQLSILKNRIAGLGRSRKTAVFPKLVFSVKAGLNLKISEPNYDIKQLALECASKRMYPDILNYDSVVKVTGSFKSPMGCRSFLEPYEENGELIHEGRNNIGVISLNLPRIAIRSNGCEETFYKLLDDTMIVAREGLDTRISRLDSVKARVAPILYMEGACGVRLKANDNISEIFKHGRASISLGYIGLHETMNALYGIGEHVYDSGMLRKKALSIVEYMKNATDRWKNETGYGFSLYSTPSENLCTRFCKIDAKEFGVIEGVTDKGYYTNSFHLDVEKHVNLYDKIDFEMPYPLIANGGFICYGEYPNIQHNIEALENVWDYSYDRVPYYGTNTPIDECYECGFKGEFHCSSKGFVCPKCGNYDSTKVSVTRRVCGYLGSPDARPFNDGKQEEVRRRVKHM